jgi:hypothetical protein
MRNSPAQVLHYAFSNYWGWAAVIVLALLLWLPRLSDPIDLRWDGAFIIFSGHRWPVAMATASQTNQDRLSLCNILRCSRLLLDRYSGNPLLTAVAILLRRGFRKAEVQKLQLQSRGMEFALEMIINATVHRLRITEVPTTHSPDRGDRAPHLRRHADAWRGMRLYLLMSPRWFFGIPRLVLLIFCTVVSIGLLPGPVSIGSVTFDYRALLYSTAALLMVYQCMLLSAFAKLLADETGLHPRQTPLRFLTKRRTVERLVILDLVLICLGIVVGLIATRQWELVPFGCLQPDLTIRLVTCSVLFLLLGGQTTLAGFYFGLLNLIAERGIQRGKLVSERVESTRVTANP